MIRLSDLDDKLVRAVDGARLGRVHDVLVEDGELRWLEYGTRGFLERLRGHGSSDRLPWSVVRDVRDDAIIVDLG